MFDPIFRVDASLSVERIRKIAPWERAKTAAFIDGDSARIDPLVKKYFSGYHAITVTDGVRSPDMPIGKYLMPKLADGAGFQIADFIIQAAGAQSRLRVKGPKRVRCKDFAAVLRPNLACRARVMP